VIDAEIDSSGIGSDVVGAARYDLAELGDDKLVHPDRSGLPLWGGKRQLEAVSRGGSGVDCAEANICVVVGAVNGGVTSSLVQYVCACRADFR
jgi:hypothetical protein